MDCHDNRTIASKASLPRHLQDREDFQLVVLYQRVEQFIQQEEALTEFSITEFHPEPGKDCSQTKTLLQSHILPTHLPPDALYPRI